MISAAGIEDQELSVGSERSGIHDPAIARGRDLARRPGSRSRGLFRCRRSRRARRIRGSGAVDRQRQRALARRRRRSRARAGPGSLQRARGWPSVGPALPGPPRAAARAAAAISCSSWPIRSLRLSACRASCGGPLRAPPRAPSRFRLACAGAPATSTVMRVLSSRKCGEITAEAVAFGSNFAAHAHEFGEIGDQRVGLDLHVGQHRAEQDRGAHRLQRILRANQQGRRRPAARCAAGPRAPRRSRRGGWRASGGRVSSLPLSAVEPLFGRGDAVLDVADACAAELDQRRVELAAVLADRVDLGLELGGEVGGLLLLGLDLVQLLLPRALGGLRRATAVARRRPAVCAAPDG